MSVCYAVSHIGIGGRRYRPGERLPELDDAQWERLMKLGAIRTEFAAQDEEEAHGARDGEAREPDGGQEPDGEPEPDEDEQDEADMPEVDATDGIVEEEPEEAPAPRKRTRKTA